MLRLFRASCTIALTAVVAVPAIAADLPEVKVSATNKVPACATPGRLMAYLHARNPKFNDRFDGVATQYMRYGEELGLRWDIAFFQMILETGALSFTGDVRANQNNFAGLGASGGGNHGERFADIPTGVKAHLQHLLMYAGEHIDNPVAERTRKVQDWGVLTEWQHSIKGPMTFSALARQWAPGSRGYVRDIATIEEGFYDSYCNMPDPQPELVAEARKGRETKPATQVAAVVPDPSLKSTDANKDAGTNADMNADTGTPKVSGAEIARRAIAEERAEDPPRAGLGAGMLGAAATNARAAAASEPAPQAPAVKVEVKAETPPVTLINPTKRNDQPAVTHEPAAKASVAKTADKPAAKRTNEVADKAADKVPTRVRQQGWRQGLRDANRRDHRHRHADEAAVQ